MFYYESSRRKLDLRLLLFVLRVVCECLGKFYALAIRTKVMNYGGVRAFKTVLDGTTRVR